MLQNYKRALLLILFQLNFIIRKIKQIWIYKKYQNMKLKIYNTLTRTKEDFIPLMEDPNYHWPAKDFVGIYSCWPTVYYTSHIGNLRATFTADLIRNTLKLLWYNVKAVMNITDVGHLVSDADEWEDKMEKWSKRDWKSAWDIAKQYEKVFKENMRELHIDEFDVMPRATNHISEQIELVKILENKWYTYKIDWDGIYMDTSKVADYGKLMWPNYKKRLADLIAGERVEMWWKKNPTDFALWKFSSINEKRQMERDSPWGIWFPGRHIECSAMSSKYLWQQFDIHHWWADHITIHHPNEIAQSECIFDVNPWVKYRVHNEFLQVDGGKMWKSLGNAYILEDIKNKWYSPLDLRYFYFMAQYWNFQNFTWNVLDQAQNSRKNLIKKLSKSPISNLFENIQSFAQIENKLKSEMWKKFRTEIMEAICDDINTPQVLSVINSYISEPNEEIISMMHRLENNFLKVWLFDIITEEKIEIPQEVTQLAEQRIQAKKDKNYTLADELRNKVKDMGYEIKDTKDWFEIDKI